LDEVDRLEQDQKWPEAQAAAKRAEAALAGGEADDATGQRVRDVLRELEFIDRVERIWPDLAISVEGNYNLRWAVRNYAQAFRDSGVAVEHLPAEAATAALRARPALTACVATALDHWVIARKRLGEPEPNWKDLVAVAHGLDPHPLRDRLRTIWGRPIT